MIGGRYRLVRVIGAGAMGVVWSARNESTERDFAIKLMTPESAKDPARLQRFFKEAKLAGRLRHRCIVEVYDLGRIEGGLLNGAPYLVMELLDGEPLDGMLRRVGQLPAGTALRIVSDVARGLSVAHAQGVVHRDLKPANVFLHRTLEGRTVPKILDFGISKLLSGSLARESFNPQETTIGTILGSPAYMSPEQTSGEDLDARADIWSLGIMLYKALCGALPFSGANFTTLMLAINTGAPAPLEDRAPGLPRDVYALVAKCLSRRRGDRYVDAAALADAIDRIVATHELEVLELSQVVGDVLPIPSEHMKTIELGVAAASATLKSAATLEMNESTRAFEDSLDTPMLEEERPLTSDVIPPAQPPARAPMSRGRVAAVFAALGAIVAIAIVAPRIRVAPEPPPAAAPSPKSFVPPPDPIVVEPVATVASATPSASASIMKPLKLVPVRPAAPKAKQPDGAHEGLVRPGF
jgi:serine/threonine protein kinase